MGKCRALSEEQIRATIDVLNRSKQRYRNACMFILGVSTGLRITEILSIRVGDVMNSDGTPRNWLTIAAANCKGSLHQRRLPLSDAAKKAVHEAVNERYALGASSKDAFLFSPAFRRGSISRIQAYRIIADALTAAGITHTKGTHTMRKTFASLLMKASERAYQDKEMQAYPLVAVQLGLGHRDLATTRKYLEDGVEAVNDIIRKGLF